MTNFGELAAAADLDRALRYRDEIFQAASEKRLSPALIAAIGSRETRWDPHWFLGDIDKDTHQPHGHGPMQVDDGLRHGRIGKRAAWCLAWRKRWHDQDPTAVIDAIREACDVFKETHAAVAERVDPAAPDFVLTVLAAYNCDLGTVLHEREIGNGPDYRTTSSHPSKPGEPWHAGDYGTDVLERWRWFETHGFKAPPLPDEPWEQPTTEVQVYDPTSWKDC